MWGSTSARMRIVIISLALAVATGAAYAPVMRNDFVAYDDPRDVTDNAIVQKGLTAEGFRWAFTTGTGGSWNPLVWLSHLADCQLYGLDARGHHATDLGLHVLNSVGLFLVLTGMTGALWPSAFVGAAFALHPLHVESVAWVTERKDTLSTFFWIATLGAYAWYARRPGLGRYLAVMGVYVLALMSKPMVVTLPLVLMLLDVWPLGRLRLVREKVEAAAKPAAKRVADRKRQPPKPAPPPAPDVRFPPSSLGRLVLEKLPLLALAAGVSVLTIITQQAEGAMMSTGSLSMGARIENAIVSYVLYLGKMLWPMRLGVFYPARPLSLGEVGGALALLLALTAVALATVRRVPAVAVGWFWYVGTLVPVIGIIQVGAQAMADRYTYVPLIGIFVAIAWGVPVLLGGMAPRVRAPLLASAAGAALVACAVATNVQAGYWRNSESLYRHTLDVTTGNFMIHYNLGQLLDRQKQFAEAEQHYLASAKAHSGFSPPRLNLGVLYANQGRNKEAAEYYGQALRVAPGDARAYNSYANLLASEGRIDESVTQFQQAVRLKPDFFEAYSNLGLNLVRAGRYDEAITAAQSALRYNPRFAQAHNVIGAALAKQGKPAQAIAAYREALRLMPAWPPAERRLAWLLATCPDDAFRDPTEALRLAEHASQATGGRDPEMLDTLAAAQAAAGRTGDAVETAGRALAAANDASKPALTTEIEGRLGLYRAGQPYREASGVAASR